MYVDNEVKSLSRVRPFATPWTVACQAPPPMGFPRQEYWSGSPFPSPRDFPDPEIEPKSPALQADSLPSEPPQAPNLTRLYTFTLKLMEMRWKTPCPQLPWSHLRGSVATATSMPGNTKFEYCHPGRKVLVGSVAWDPPQSQSRLPARSSPWLGRGGCYSMAVHRGAACPRTRARGGGRVARWQPSACTCLGSEHREPGSVLNTALHTAQPSPGYPSALGNWCRGYPGHYGVWSSTHDPTQAMSGAPQ